MRSNPNYPVKFDLNRDEFTFFDYDYDYWDRKPHLNERSVASIGGHEAPYFAALLDCYEAIPLLLELEKNSQNTSSCLSLNMEFQQTSRISYQYPLRLLGAKPFYPGSIALTKCGQEMIPDISQCCVDRQTGFRLISPGVSTGEAYQLLGYPDYVDRAETYVVTKETQNEFGSSTSYQLEKYVWFMRYDMDTDSPYSVLIWLSDDNTMIRKVETFTPALWSFAKHAQFGRYLDVNGNLCSGGMLGRVNWLNNCLESFPGKRVERG